MIIRFAAILIVAVSLSAGAPGADSKKTDGGPVIKSRFDSVVKLRLNQKAVYPDGLDVTLDSFSHKRVETGQDLRADAYFTIQVKGQITKLQLASTRPPASEKSNYESVFLGEYYIRLRNFIYDECVDLEINKFAADKIKYAQVYALTSQKMAMLPDGMKIELKQMGYEVNEETQKQVRFADLDVLEDNAKGGRLSFRLYENGTQALYGKWVGEPGIHVSGRIIQLHKMNKDDVELICKTSQE